MMRTSFTLLFLLLCGPILNAQINGGHVVDGHSPGNPDSSIITFGAVQSPHIAPYIFATLDTAGTTLWQIGSTNKSFFTASGPVAGGIMTDTTSAYPVSANQWFVLKVNKASGGTAPTWINPIFGFTHRYQTTANKDGGIVEYSLDTGATWNNVRGGCYQPTLADSFYSASDTLQNGTPAFSGTSSGWRTSRFQLFQGIPLKGAACPMRWPVWIRFRFLSDTVAENLNGWLISSIKIERDYYGNEVHNISRQSSLPVYPNPATDGHFQWPQLETAGHYSLLMTDLAGRVVWKGAYRTATDFSALLPGTYFYRVDNGAGDIYSGKLVR